MTGKKSFTNRICGSSKQFHHSTEQEDSMGDLVSPRRRDVYDRLRRRIEHYRSHNQSHLARLDQPQHGHLDQQRQETLLLQQRWLESKAKRSSKSNKSNRDTTSQHTNNQITVSSFTCAQQHNKKPSLSLRVKYRLLVFRSGPSYYYFIHKVSALQQYHSRLRSRPTLISTSRGS